MKMTLVGKVSYVLVVIGAYAAAAMVSNQKAVR